MIADLGYKNTKSISLRLDMELKACLEVRAGLENSSTNHMINNILEEYLKEEIDICKMIRYSSINELIELGDKFYKEENRKKYAIWYGFYIRHVEFNMNTPHSLLGLRACYAKSGVSEKTLGELIVTPIKEKAWEWKEKTEDKSEYNLSEVIEQYNNNNYLCYDFDSKESQVPLEQVLKHIKDQLEEKSYLQYRG